MRLHVCGRLHAPGGGEDQGGGAGVDAPGDQAGGCGGGAERAPVPQTDSYMETDGESWSGARGPHLVQPGPA